MSTAHQEQAPDQGTTPTPRFRVWHGGLAALLSVGLVAAGLVPAHFLSQRKDNRMEACREQVIDRFRNPHLLHVIGAAGFLALKISLPETTRAAKYHREYAGSGIVTVEAPELIAAVVDRQTGRYDPSISGLQNVAPVKDYTTYPFQNPLRITHGVTTVGPIVANFNLKNNTKIVLWMAVAADCIDNEPVFGGVAEVDRWAGAVSIGSVVFRKETLVPVQAQAGNLPTTFRHEYDYIYGGPQP